MPEEEEKKKRTKKLVVEETSAPEPPVEAVIDEASNQEEIEEKEEAKEVVEEPNAEEPVVFKKETPRKSILIPIDEKEVESSSEKTENQDSKVSIFWVILLALFIVASLVGGGMLIFRAGVEKGKLETPAGTETVSSPSPTAVASPSAEVKREDFKVQVLNGTGTAGVAASAQEYLEGLGYKDVGIGNAETSDFTETEISIKDSKKDYLETLKKDLSEKYGVSATTKTLTSANEFDAVVTVGTSTN